MTCALQGAVGDHSPMLVDGWGRRIDHLRLSLTDRCNLSCRYCAAEGARPASVSTIPRHFSTRRAARAEARGSSLSGNRAWSSRPYEINADFAAALVRWIASRHGVRHLRLTGGEPLLYPDLLPLIERLRDLGTLDELTLTTNGQALAGRARALGDAGLSRVNVSMDTLDPERFARITRGGRLIHTLRGIEAALDSGLTPVRINVVVQRGINEDEVGALAAWGMSHGCTVRFLELMPIGGATHTIGDGLVPAAEILERLADRFALRPRPCPRGQPATEYAVTTREDPGLVGVVGVIASTTRPFCSCCRRIRVTARGELLSCLFDTGGSHLAEAWNGHTLDEGHADRILQAAVMAKPVFGGRHQPNPMMSIGG